MLLALLVVAVLAVCGAAADEAGMGIVATVSAVDDVVRDWACFHRRAGFERLFLFLDGIDDTPEGDAEAAAVGDAEGWTGWAVVRPSRRTRLDGLALTPRYGPFVESEVMARQLLNAEVAVGDALAHGVGWLLHIDGDEMWTPPGEMTLREHVASLNARKMTTATYLNMEAVPRSSSARNIFTDTTVFKRNQITFTTEAQQAVFQRFHEVRVKYFQGYFVGKQAARVHARLLPDEVTNWQVPKGNRTAMALQRHATFDGPWILHFINADFDKWTAKFRQLGHFSDTVFDRSRAKLDADADRSVLPPEMTVLPFHKWSRDMVLAHGDDTAAIRAEFERVSVLGDRARETMLRKQVLTAIRHVADVVAGQCARAGGAAAAIDTREADRWAETRQAPFETCAHTPHFFCSVAAKPCCDVLDSPAYTYPKIQMGYAKNADGRWGDWTDV